MSDLLKTGELRGFGGATATQTPSAPARLMPRSGTGRSGVVLLATIVCVAIMTVLFVSILKLAGAQRHRLQTRRWQAQATWLAESGLERAVWRLGGDGGYSGETWTLSAEQLGTPQPAVVNIEVEAVAEQPRRRLVRVRADYPDHPVHRARLSKRAVVRVPQREGEE